MRGGFLREIVEIITERVYGDKEYSVRGGRRYRLFSLVTGAGRWIVYMSVTTGTRGVLKRRRRSLHFLRRGFRGTHEYCISLANRIIVCKFRGEDCCKIVEIDGYHVNVDIFGDEGGRAR